MEGKDASRGAGPSQLVPTTMCTLRGLFAVYLLIRSILVDVCRWSPAHKIRHYDCWKTYSYPDQVVLTVDDERR